MINFFICLILITNRFHFIISAATYQTKTYLDKHVCQREYTKSKNVIPSSSTSTKECYRNLDDFHGKDEYCLHKLNSKFFTNCYVYSIDLEYNNLNVKDIFAHLPTSDVDSNSAIQMIKITFVSGSSKTGTNSSKSSMRFNYTMVGELIDNFLIPRPLWRVVREPFEWYNKTHSSFKYNTTSSRHSGHSANNQIVLKKVMEPLHPYLKFISKLQYPSAHMCNISPMLFGYYSCGNPGWTAVMHTYYDDKQKLKYGIHSIFSGKKREFGNLEWATKNFFMSEEDCPHKRNTWDCAFLSMTNCSLPVKLEPDGKELRGFSNVYTNAGPKGQKVKLLTLNKEIQDFDISHANASKLGFPSYEEGRLKDYSYIYGVPYDPSYRLQYQIRNVDVSTTTYLFGYMLRQTYLYRSKIAKLIQSFRSKFKPRLTERSECVVAHVRRGDRGIYGLNGKRINITQYCYNASHDMKCEDREGKLSACNLDAGCSSHVPYSLVELEHVVSKVPLLVGPKLKNLLIFTDDMGWLQDELKSFRERNMYTDWNFYYLDVPDPSLTADQVHKGFVRYGKATESGVYLHASLALAKQCRAFIGHFGSATAYLFYTNMCHLHRHMEGHCPPSYDLAKGLVYTPPPTTTTQGVVFK